jgi:hypothetical protein
MKPVVDGLAKSASERYEVRIMNESTGDPEVGRLATALGIQYVPTFVFVNSDGTRGATIVGETPVATLQAELARLK